MSEADPEQETIESVRRFVGTGLMAAMQTVDRLSRQREQHLRQAEAESDQRRHELRARLDAERSTARALVADSRRPEFWEHAQPHEVVRAYAAAAAWADRDPAMETDRRRLGTEISTRYGVDVDDLRDQVREAAKVAAAAAESGRDEHEQQSAASELVGAAQARQDALSKDDATSGLSAAGAAAEGRYDGAEARLARAQRLRDAGMHEEGVRARGLADTGWAHSAAETAQAGATAKTPRASQSRTPAPSRSRDQGRGLGR